MLMLCNSWMWFWIRFSNISLHFFFHLYSRRMLVCGFLGHSEIKDLASQDASAFLSAANGHFCPWSIPGTWGQVVGFFFWHTWSLPTRMLNTCSWLLSRNALETEVSKVSSKSNQRNKYCPRRELLQRAVGQVTGECPNYSSHHYDKIHTNATSRRTDFV